MKNMSQQPRKRAVGAVVGTSAGAQSRTMQTSVLRLWAAWAVGAVTLVTTVGAWAYTQVDTALPQPARSAQPAQFVQPAESVQNDAQKTSDSVAEAHFVPIAQAKYSELVPQTIEAIRQKNVARWRAQMQTRLPRQDALYSPAAHQKKIPQPVITYDYEAAQRYAQKYAQKYARYKTTVHTNSYTTGRSGIDRVATSGSSVTSKKTTTDMDCGECKVGGRHTDEWQSKDSWGQTSETAWHTSETQWHTEIIRSHDVPYTDAGWVTSNTSSWYRPDIPRTPDIIHLYGSSRTSTRTTEETRWTNHEETAWSGIDDWNTENCPPYRRAEQPKVLLMPVMYGQSARTPTQTVQNPRSAVTNTNTNTNTEPVYNTPHTRTQMRTTSSQPARSRGD